MSQNNWWNSGSGQGQKRLVPALNEVRCADIAQTNVAIDFSAFETGLNITARHPFPDMTGSKGVNCAAIVESK
jgi:hypothetical protein